MVNMTEAHRRLRELCDRRYELQLEKQEALEQARRLGVHTQLGYATIEEYEMALFGEVEDA